ncbi:MAG: hypothetical protein ACF8CY_05055, partial [Gimesia chilikensis]
MLMFRLSTFDQSKSMGESPQSSLGTGRSRLANRRQQVKNSVVKQYCQQTGMPLEGLVKTERSGRLFCRSGAGGNKTEWNSGVVPVFLITGQVFDFV